VPFSRPKSFTGREKQLAHLRTLISLGGDHRLAIHGLGGCGKTALALEFAYWTKKHHTTHAIFWVPATSQGSFEKAYYDIAKLLDIPGYSDSQVNIKDLVKSHLSDSNFGPWLIIVDNADNVDLLFGDDGEDRDHGPLISYLPQSSRGCIVFTTRIRATAIKAAENNIIELGDLERREATEILCRRLFHEHHSELKMVETVSEFLEMLRFHALAIIQAIAFINTNDVSLADYITLYRHSEGDAMDLLSEEFEDQTRYQEASNSVATTWFVSFEQIQKHDAVAADHLFFMACIANNEITASMFPPIYSKVQHTKAIGMLKAYAFITERQPQSDKLWVQPQTIHKTFDIHPLVHLAIRGWLKAHDQWTLWTRKTMARLVEIVPYGDHDTRDYWTTYMHHAMHLLNQSEVQELSGRMALLEKIGRCERSLGRYQASERAYRRAFDQRVRTSGAENPETLMTMGNIALALGYQERWMEAEKMHKEELAIAEKVLGKKSPQTLISRGNLGLAMLGQWKFREAEELYRELLELDKEVLGEKSTETLAAMQNLAGALCGQGKHAEAEQVHRKTLALSKEIRGEEHADTLSSLSALGTALRSQCKYIEAEQIHHEELVLRKKVLGDEHPDTVKTMQKLGNVLCVQERYVEAEKIQREALAISSKELGDENPVTLKCWSALAHTLHNQKHYAEAEQIHRNTLAVREKVMGKVHRDTLMSVYWLAELLHDQMQYQNAMQLYDRALAGFQSTLGPEHSVTKECLELCTWIREAVDEERIAEAAKREQCIANEAATEDAVVGAQVSSTAEVALRPHKRWRARLHRIVNKSTGR
jgi:tetratricopeptide (TPR) repeat protein